MRKQARNNNYKENGNTEYQSVLFLLLYHVYFFRKKKVVILCPRVDLPTKLSTTFQAANYDLFH